MLNKLNIRLSFLITTLVIALLLVTPIPFLTRIIREVPLISFFLGEISLVFLVILASFPKAGIKEIISASSQFLLVIAICVGILSLIPLQQDFRLFAFGEIEAGIPNLVSINVIGIIVLNFIVCFLLNLELKRQKSNPNNGSFSKRRSKNLSMEQINADAESNMITKMGSELKKEVNSLFDLYLKEYESGDKEENIKLQNFEAALLENISNDITGAVCVDKNGLILKDTVFTWSGYPKESLIEMFKRDNHISSELGTGILCQKLFIDNGVWYVIAKFRGNYLIMQTDRKDPSPLLETTYKVFKALKIA